MLLPGPSLRTPTRRPLGGVGGLHRAFGHHEDGTSTHGYAATREGAMTAFAKGWRREMDLERRRVRLAGWILGRHVRSGQDSLPSETQSYFQTGRRRGLMVPIPSLLFANFQSPRVRLSVVH